MTSSAAPQSDDAARPPVDWSIVDRTSGPLGLAVSGGSDSTALAILFHEARPERIGGIITVDHGLRASAAEDVAAVKTLGATLGVAVTALTVNEPAPRHRSPQAWARDQRHALFRDAAADLGFGAVVLAHTLEDQAETVLMRLGRGSGLKGLAAIRPVAERDGLTLLRPLLGCRREALRAMLRSRGIAWREDPSNHDVTFTRVAVRTALPRLAPLGLTPERLAATAAHLARASDAIDTAADALLAQTRWDRARAVTTRLSDYASAPEEVRLRALSALIVIVGGQPYGPEFDPLAHADRALLEPDASLTLGRAQLVRRGPLIVMWREARDLPELTVAPGGTAIFDGRYQIKSSLTRDPMRIRAIGAALARALPAVAHPAAMATTPGVFDADGCVCAPTLGLWRRGIDRTAVRITPVRHCAPRVAP